MVGRRCDRGGCLRIRRRGRDCPVEVAYPDVNRESRRQAYDRILGERRLVMQPLHEAAGCVAHDCASGLGSDIANERHH
jgi:hypothetical protein